jgi:hypothetical protein
MNIDRRGFLKLAAGALTALGLGVKAGKPPLSLESYKAVRDAMPSRGEPGPEAVTIHGLQSGDAGYIYYDSPAVDDVPIRVFINKAVVAPDCTFSIEVASSENA